LSLKFNIKELSLPVVKDVIVNNFFGVFNTLSTHIIPLWQIMDILVFQLLLPRP